MKEVLLSYFILPVIDASHLINPLMPGWWQKKGHTHLIFNALVLFISKDLYYNFPCGAAMKLLENFPSSCKTFLILTWAIDNISSQSTKTVIFVEFIIKPKY